MISKVGKIIEQKSKLEFQSKNEDDNANPAVSSQQLACCCCCIGAENNNIHVPHTPNILPH
jgi:hypothetical protein